MTKRKKIIIWLAAALAVIAFLVSPLAATLRSMAVMGVYSAQERKLSVAAERGFEVKIPSGKGWFPFVMTYNADEDFAVHTGVDGAKLTVLYNFPAFDAIRGCSRLFDEASAYYNSFYGAYLVSFPDGGAYGFEPSGVTLEDAVYAVARLDLFGLVLGDFGLPANERVFEYEVLSRDEDLAFAGSDGWTRVDASIRVNGANHAALSGVRSYWQYGKPNFPVSEPFAPVDMVCTVFAQYFAEWDTTVFFYVMARDSAVCDECVSGILADSTIR